MKFKTIIREFPHEILYFRHNDSYEHDFIYDWITLFGVEVCNFVSLRSLWQSLILDNNKCILKTWSGDETAKWWPSMSSSGHQSKSRHWSHGTKIFPFGVKSLRPPPVMKKPFKLRLNKIYKITTEENFAWKKNKKSKTSICSI